MLLPSDIDADRNGRYEDLEADPQLMASLVEHGQLSPVVLRPNPDKEGKPLLVAGFRRWAAAVALNEQLDDGEEPLLLECKLFPASDDKEALLLNISENNDRLDTSPIDDAHNMHRLIHDHGMTQKEVADHYGFKAVSVVNKRLSLLWLAPAVQRKLHKGEMTLVAALELVGFDAQQQQESAQLGPSSSSGGGGKHSAAADSAPSSGSSSTTSNTGSTTAGKKRGRPRKHPGAKVKTLKDTRNIFQSMADDEHEKLTMFSGVVMSWMDGKLSDNGLKRKLRRLFDS